VRALAAIAFVLFAAARLSAQVPDLVTTTEAKTPAEARIEGLERRIRELESRIRDLERSSGGATTSRDVPARSDTKTVSIQTPAAAAVTPNEGSPAPQTGPLSGYMDFHFNKLQHEDGQLDFHRFVLLVNHSFSDRLRFIGELELEHAFVSGLEASGELELEQAYLDFRIRPEINLRAGMLLAPVGIINERHEPPSFNGVERPFVDTFII
jgi:hypothetical protein